MNCDKMKNTSSHILRSYERSIHLVLQWLAGNVPFYLVLVYRVLEATVAYATLICTFYYYYYYYYLNFYAKLPLLRKRRCASGLSYCIFGKVSVNECCIN